MEGADAQRILGRESSDSTEVDEKGGKWIGNDTPLLAIPMFNECPFAYVDVCGVVPNGPGISRRDSRYSPQSSASPDSWAGNDAPARTVPMFNQYVACWPASSDAPHAPDI